ncbi:Membrane-bound transcription factor site-2 protease [Nowakowskiella sp. JEL0407]|nr:Membrane-bound transcription factor site-2 protease [Nowakowskiella sp. JEL0407]
MLAYRGRIPHVYGVADVKSQDVTAATLKLPYSFLPRYSTGPLLDQPGSGKDFLVALIPGVNLPFHALGYYFVAMLVVGIFHELGHALAALNENVPVQASGLFFFILYPGAFVELYQPALSLLKPFKKLRIICAGVWHNITLGVFAWSLLQTLPYWLGLGYSSVDSDTGVVALDVKTDSPLHGHIFPGNKIMWLDRNEVKGGISSWETGLMKSVLDDSEILQGYCMTAPSAETVRNAAESCCQVSTEHPLGNSQNTKQCFIPRNQVLSFRKIGLPEGKFAFDFFSNITSAKCDSLQEVMKKAPNCFTDYECMTATSNGICMAAYIPNLYIRLVKLRVRELDAKERVVTFLGDPREVWEAVQVGSLYPRWSFLPLSLPYVVEQLLHFTFSFTLALAFINMVPAKFLDGHHALIEAVNLIIERIIRSGGEDMRTSARTLKLEKTKANIVEWIVRISTVMLGMVMVIGAVNAFLSV